MMFWDPAGNWAELSMWPSVEPERAVLALAGAEAVVAPDGDEDTLASLAEEIEAAGGYVSTMEVDVLDGRQVEQMVGSIVDRFNAIDILVNAVGSSTTIPNNDASVDDLTFDDWDRVIPFNL